MGIFLKDSLGKKKDIKLWARNTVSRASKKGHACCENLNDRNILGEVEPHIKI